MKKTILVLGAAIAAGFIPVVWAHHSFAEFDPERIITLEGVVTEFRLVNPHAMMTFEVMEENGETQEWRVEFDGRLNLSRAGWVPDTIKPGETVSITGNPAVSGSPFMIFQSGMKGDGTALVRPMMRDIQAIEEQRRQRREAGGE